MTGMRPPKVSVLMPVYKGDEYLSEAVDSILNQTFTDFEFIIICDDPTEKTRQILDKYEQSDSRIKVYYQEREGLVNSLNRGCSLARGEYIARMDADDISLPERFEKQSKFLDSNQCVGVLGTDIRFIDCYGNPHPDVHPPYIPTEPNVIQWYLMFYCCIQHPTVMFRKSVYDQMGGYSNNFLHAEDYEFWLRISPRIIISNLDDVLVHLRIHANSVSRTFNEVQKRNADIADKNAISELLQKEIDLPQVQVLRHPDEASCSLDLLRSAFLLKNMYTTYCKTKKPNKSDIRQIKKITVQRMVTLLLVSLKKYGGSRGILDSLRIYVWASLLCPIEANKSLFNTVITFLKKI